MVLAAESDSYMAKIATKHARRLCPLGPQDYPLLGIPWGGSYYVDTRLPLAAYLCHLYLTVLQTPYGGSSLLLVG